ncbi:protein toll-like [Anastrepha ludens]|uniref:protein toll-like n=1 Tax=Anastrepha ludens TaxID=28586 RepID=UPI0023AF886A|nr:protein toll-like [Anastrepha ludens]
MDFVQLPAEIFAPVAQTLSELHLVGRLRAIPANTFGVFRNLTELALLGHQFERRLRANDFTALDTLQVLKLQTCSIILLPAYIFFPLVASTWLNLETNRLRLLPDTLLAQQRQLRRLDLNDNQLEALPAALFESSTKLQKLFLTNNRLRSISADILPPHNALVELYVDVNELHTITPGTFRQTRHLRRLILSHNKLDWTRAEACAMFDGLRSLTELALQNNSLRFLCNQLGTSNQSTSFLSFLDQNAAGRIHNNPWSCDCSAQPLHAFLRSNRVRFPDVRHISCYEAQRTPLIELSYRDLCPLDLGVNAQLVRMFIYFSTLSLVVITGALCYYKYKLQLKIWLYAHSLCLRCISEAELDCDRKYDAFISYTHQDKHFVELELLPGLEQATPAFKVCIHVRDWLVGAFISEQIIDSVEESRRTIIVLSQHFIQSEWTLMEFRMAHQCALNEGRSRVILVIYGDSVDMELLDQELRAYLKMNTYLKWGEPWFWEKLRYAMPHSRLSWEREECANRRANEIPLQTMMTQAQMLHSAIPLQLILTAIALAVSLLFPRRCLCQANISGDQSFITDVCAEIASNGTCNCAYSTSGVFIDCGSAHGHIQIQILVFEQIFVKIFCKPAINTKSLITTEQLANLPLLGGMHKIVSLSVHRCLPFTEMLAQLALQQCTSLELNDLEFVPLLTARHLGQNLSYLQTVTVLELLAHPQFRALHAAQQLDADLFIAFYSLVSLKIDLHFTQLPQGLFTPVAATLSDLMLYGRLSDFPRKSFGSLSRMSALTMSGHQLADRLREGDFEALGLLELLTLSSCGITVLPARIFAPLPSLKSLLLRANQLRVLPTGLFAAQINLQVLELSRNQLEALPLGLFHPSTKLVNLSLSRNRLLQLSAEILPPLHGLETLRLDGNRLRTIASGCFAEAQHLKILLLDHNRLNWTSAEACDVFNGLRSLRLLGLNNNSLSHLCDQLSAPNHTTNSLRVLDVRHNRLTRLSAQLLHTLNSSISKNKLYLSHNPWVCDCGAQLLHAFVKSNRMRFSDMFDVRCENSQLAPLVELSYHDFCLPDLGVRTSVVLTFIWLSAFSLSVITTALFYYKYKLQLQIWLYAHRWCLCCISEAELDCDRKYDAFISYTHQDEHFVEHELVPGLEQGTPAFKVCIHVRDWLAGAFISEQIIDSVEQSRRTIIVLSQHFIQSEWALMEFRMAHQCALNEGRSRIILVIYGDSVDMELLDQELRAYLKMNTYLKWGEPWFWEKLRYAMPHSRRGWQGEGRTKRRTDEISLQPTGLRA